MWCCRICGGGRYHSEHESPKQRELRKARKVRKRLGQKAGGLLTTFPVKPEGMHPAHCWGIREKAEKLEREFLLEQLDALPTVTISRLLKKSAIASLVPK